MDENEFDFYDLEEEVTRVKKEESENEESKAYPMKEPIGSENEEREVQVLKKKIESENEETKTHLLKEVIKSENEEREMSSCSECDINYDQESDLLEHIESVHTPKDNKFSCDLCCERLVSYRQLKQHMKKKHATKQKKLVELSKVSVLVNNVDQNNLLKANVKEELLEDSHDSDLCILCGKQFGSHQKMVAHVAVVHSQG